MTSRFTFFLPHGISLLAVLVTSTSLVWARPSQKPPIQQKTQWTGKILGEIEGNAITVISNGTSTKIRLYGVGVGSGADREDEQRAKEASSALNQSLHDKLAQVNVVGQDDEHNPLAWVFVGKVCLNAELIRAGVGHWDQANAPREVKLGDLEQQARNQRVGVWAQPRADLILTHVEFKPDHIVAGQFFQPYVYVKNIGSAPTPKFYIYQYKWESSDGGYGGTFALQPGEESMWLTGGLRAPAPGTYTIHYTADLKNDVNEWNRDNNGFDATITIYEK